MIIKDQLNREISFSEIPERIVSLVPSLTELLCDLGLADRIVGVTKFCIHPEEIRKKAEIIGGTKKIKLSECLDLKPDFILANKEENIKHQVQNLSEHATVYTSHIATLNDLMRLNEDLGYIFDIKERASQLNQELENIQNHLRELSKNTQGSAIYLIWKDPYMAAGGDTYISTMMNLLGIDNAIADQNRYPIITPEVLKKSECDYIFLSSEPYPFKDHHVKDLQMQLDGKKVLLVNGELFSWYGSRILHMQEYIRVLTSLL